MSKLNKHDILKEQALDRFELLLDYWGVEYEKINSKEYDIIATWREDSSFGACRFNVNKGRGADFAGTGLTANDCAAFGNGFTEDDFSPFIVNFTANNRECVSYSGGFDIISLCQRVNKLNSRGEAVETLRVHLAELDKVCQFKRVTHQAIQERLERRQQERDQRKEYAAKTWKVARGFEGTLGDKYLQSRNIHVQGELNIKYHGKVYNTEIKGLFPCLLFRVSQQPDSELTAVHRVYLDSNGNKLNCSNPKVALGSVAGNAIWFGNAGEQLCIAEGPENALSIRCLGYEFVASSVNAANFSGLAIPSYVREIILFPDPDAAGRAGAEKAVKRYSTSKVKVSVCFPPGGGDWNDALIDNS